VGLGDVAAVLFVAALVVGFVVERRRRRARLHGLHTPVEREQPPGRPIDYGQVHTVDQRTAGMFDDGF
jgi:hypothetical protein